MLIFNSILLVLLDLYIYKALRSTRIGFAKKTIFPWVWWGYSLLIILGVLIGIYLNIPLMARSIILVAFFLTFTVKFIYVLIIAMDDIRRGGVWLARLIGPRKWKQSIPERIETEKSLPETPVKGISRSDFLMKAGILVASAPLVP